MASIKAVFPEPTGPPDANSACIAHNNFNFLDFNS